MKTMEMRRDDEHEEDVVLRLIFETLCKRVHREMPCSHRRRRPPLKDKARCTWLSLSSSFDGASMRDVARTMVMMEWGIHL